MLKYISKFAMDILPSVIATIIGAYIVNHYIVTKPGAGAPIAAATSSADPKPTSVEVANLPEPGVKAKGVSEKAILEKTAAEKPAVVEKPAEKSADKPAETASIPTASIPSDSRRHPAVPREKTVAKTVPAQGGPAIPAAPAIAEPGIAAPVEAVTPAEERRDANELARAAIERLRGTSEGSPRVQEAARMPEVPRVVTAPPPMALPSVAATPVRPLPPPIMVSTPAAEALDATTGTSSPQGRPSYPVSGRDDPGRPIPPAEIPMASPPLDLRADATEPLVREHRTVAEDMVSAAKSVFHAVLPK
jgi:hypothetical protein